MVYYNSILCEDLIKRMSDISEDEKSAMIDEVVINQYQCPNVTAIEVQGSATNGNEKFVLTVTPKKIEDAEIT